MKTFFLIKCLFKTIKNLCLLFCSISETPIQRTYLLFPSSSNQVKSRKISLESGVGYIISKEKTTVLNICNYIAISNSIKIPL